MCSQVMATLAQFDLSKTKMHNIKDPTASIEGVEEVRALEDACLLLRRKGDMSDEAASQVLNLLTKTPMSYTFWNYRRDFLSSHQSADNELVLLVREHHITTQALEKNPKIYPVWEHRKFVFNRLLALADDPEMVTKLKKEEHCFIATKLSEDPRNFHAWNYQRNLFDHVDLSFLYTLLNKDCSNHSALHQLALELHKIGLEKSDVGNAMFDYEVQRCLDFLRLSLLLDPNSESLWQFLIKIADILSPEVLQELIEYVILSLEQDGCSFLPLHNPVDTSSTNQIKDVYIRPPASYLLLASEGHIKGDIDKCKRYAEYCLFYDTFRKEIYNMLLQTIIHNSGQS
ncbi:Rab geranylgeranyltransferase [Giardia lamblia P15]|uniref:Geranylgeranyl transferase type-2 subunit alpha n=1 Tax=Giardia intestinalis (strain P15) TaxID=658858 RepID=E1EWC6_GIAIA|nr:Rab geranylgeranyltransferase [Giardia lamblia P15]